MDRVHTLRKIPTRLRGTNYCTSSARFAPSFVRQPNGPESNEIVRNATKRQFRVQRGGSGAFVAKNSDATSWHEQFAPSFVRQTNGPECTQIVRNAAKRQFRVQLGGSGAFVAKMHPNSTKTQQNVSLGSNGEDRVRSLRQIPTRLRGTNFWTSSARFAPSFVRRPNGPECNKIVRNAAKR